MKPYLAILRSRFLTLLQYRAAAIAGAGTQLFFGLVRMMIFEGFYRSSTTPQPMDAAQTVTYIWLGQALLLLGMLDVDRDVAGMIRSGSIVYEMARPIDLYSLWFARAVSGRAAPMVMRAIPIAIISGLLFGLAAPASLAAGVLFVTAVVGGLLLAAALIVLMTTSLLWTLSGEGIYRLSAPFIFFFSGIVIPLPLFPEWLQGVVAVLPFRGLLDTPFRIYMGLLAGPAAFWALAHQALWIVLLTAMGRALLARATNRLVAQGG